VLLTPMIDTHGRTTRPDAARHPGDPSGLFVPVESLAVIAEAMALHR
jgi:hypothetical protein